MLSDRKLSSAPLCRENHLGIPRQDQGRKLKGGEEDGIVRVLGEDAEKA